jgi:hypothetical protein
LSHEEGCPHFRKRKHCCWVQKHVIGSSSKSSYPLYAFPLMFFFLMFPSGVTVVVSSSTVCFEVALTA